MENNQIQVKDYGISTLAEIWKKGLDVEGVTPDRPTKPYSQVEWVYICVSKIIDAATSIQMLLSTANDDVIESGPVYDFLFNNKDMPFDTLLTQTVGFIALFKTCYWITLDTNGIAPTKILVAGPNICKPVIRRGELTGYTLHVNGQRIPLYVEDVYPLLGFNPDNNYEGVGPLMAGKLSISSSYQATLFNEASLANGARLSTLLSVPQGVKLDDDEKRFMRAEFETRHSGARNAGKVFLATGGVTVETLNQTMADLQMVELRRFDAATICSLFGVPPEIVGLNSEAQYAHGPATQRFINDTIGSILSFVQRHVTYGLINKYKYKSFDNKAAAFDARKHLCSRLSLSVRPSYRFAKTKAVQSRQQVFAWFAIEDHPAIQAMLRERAEKMMSYVEKGIPLNQVIDAGDLPFDHQPWGDDWWINMGQVPARFTLEAGPEGLTGTNYEDAGGDENPEEDDSKSIKEQTASDFTGEKADTRRIWKALTNSWLPVEKQMDAAMRKYFIRQQRELIDKLKKAWKQFAPEGKSVGQKDAANIVAHVTFDLYKENSKLKVINTVHFTRAAELGIRQALTELEGLTGEKLNAAARRLMSTPQIRAKLLISSQKITDINRTTAKLITRHLTEGLDKGEGLNELTRRIQTDLGANRARALRIARTQVGGAVGTGRHEGMKSAGLELKGWLSADDENVRKSHKEAEKTYADGIPVDQPFILSAGVFLMYPGDPSGPVGEIVNCRCAEIAIRAKGKSFGLKHYTQVNVYTLSDMARDKSLAA